jgi:GNAT superfamily N-acetyltransferase
LYTAMIALTLPGFIRTSLTTPPKPVIRWDMLLRLAEPADALAVARVHIRSWQAGYRALLPADFLNNLRPDERAARYDFATRDPQKPRTILAMEEDAVLGFATTSPSHDADLPDHGELCGLYVDPEMWGRGIGAALIAAARTRLIGLGFRHALLWMLAGNRRAERFYGIDGWTPDGVCRTDASSGVVLDEVRFQRQLSESL